MNLSRESMLALQRHFLGALSVPTRTWLEPLPSSPLVWYGDAIRYGREGCVLDFGTVRSPGEERRLIRVRSRSAVRTTARIGELPPWLAARWLDHTGNAISLDGENASAALELVIAPDAEREFDGSLALIIRIAGKERTETLQVRLIARQSHPFARFDFNGSPLARPFDFGSSEQPYVLSVANATSIPLLVSFADLPAWLVFEVDGRRRSGPIEGEFFQRAAPFIVKLRPQFLGQYYGALHVRTNDPRPELQDIELRFASCLVAAEPAVRSLPTRRIRLRADQKFTVPVPLKNWGRSPARISTSRVSNGLIVRECPVVPAAHMGQPGTATLPICIAPAQLGPGTYALSLSVGIEDGDPAEIDVPLRIEVTPRRSSVLRAETIAALFALLLLTLLFVLVRGVS